MPTTLVRYIAARLRNPEAIVGRDVKQRVATAERVPATCRVGEITGHYFDRQAFEQAETAGWPHQSADRLGYASGGRAARPSQRSLLRP